MIIYKKFLRNFCYDTGNNNEKYSVGNNFAYFSSQWWPIVFLTFWVVKLNLFCLFVSLVYFKNTLLNRKIFNTKCL